jgi:hypothetical protein
MILQASINLSVLDESMRYEESLIPICIMLWIRISIEDVLKDLFNVTFILNDHVCYARRSEISCCFEDAGLLS